MAKKPKQLLTILIGQENKREVISKINTVLSESEQLNFNDDITVNGIVLSLRDNPKATAIGEPYIMISTVPHRSSFIDFGGKPSMELLSKYYNIEIIDCRGLDHPINQRKELRQSNGRIGLEHFTCANSINSQRKNYGSSNYAFDEDYLKLFTECLSSEEEPFHLTDINDIIVGSYKE